MSLRSSKRPAPFLYQIEDYKERLWNVAEERPTEHGYSLLLGWPALDTEGRGEVGGGRRIIPTKELVAYLESMRMTPGKVKLPMSEAALCSLRSKIGISYRAERRKWWDQVECELSSPSPQFAAVHNFSAATANKQRKKRGITPSNRRWTEEENIRLMQLLQEGYDIPALAVALDRTKSAVISQRRILSGGTVKPYTEPRLPWTEVEKNELVEMTHAGYTHQEIASELGRTGKSIINMRSTIMGDTRGFQIWTEEDKKQVLQLALAGHTEGEIARIMDRPPGSVSPMRWRLMRDYKRKADQATGRTLLHLSNF